MSGAVGSSGAAGWDAEAPRPLPLGKLPARLLADLLRRHVEADPRVLVGPRVGEDAAVLDLGDRLLIAATDPITFATDQIGWYAVQVNANDVACCGARPRWMLAVILLPEGQATAELAERTFADLASACGELGVTLCGGHTEITGGLDRPIVVGQMLGEAPRNRLIRTGGARPGDALIVTKGVAIEGAAIIARQLPELLAEAFSEEELGRLAGWLHDPGISVVGEALLAAQSAGVHAMHDPTEGGLATGLHELAEAAGVGLEIDESRLPVLPECERMCRLLHLDPLGLIASGALLIACEPWEAERLVERLRDQGTTAAVIGEATPPEAGRTLRSADGRRRPLPEFERDELARLFQNLQAEQHD